MIDTVDLYFKFDTKQDYDDCYHIINQLSYQSPKKMKLHKKKGKSRYITTAFSDWGFLEITFTKQKSSHSYYFIYILFQPIRLISPKSQMELSTVEDYPEINLKFNGLIDIINHYLPAPILPPLNGWTVSRIDYAINITTPYTSEYIQLFHHGYIPNGFTPNHYNAIRSTESFYLHSKQGRINFYNKSLQLLKKNSSDEFTSNGKLDSSTNILRLEYQCSNRFIQDLKSKYKLQSSDLLSFWNSHIAETVLKKRVASIIGKEDFYSLAYSEHQLDKIYARKTASSCQKILFLLLRKSTLDDVKSVFCAFGKKTTNYFHQQIKKIRDAQINPITLDILNNCSEENSIRYLRNPYNLIKFSSNDTAIVPIIET